MSSPSLSSLVVAWTEAFEQGNDLSAEQLCPDHPELADELARRIDAVRIRDDRGIPVRRRRPSKGARYERKYTTQFWVREP